MGNLTERARTWLGLALAVGAGVLLPFAFHHAEWGHARMVLVALGAVGVFLAWPPPPHEEPPSASPYITASRAKIGLVVLALGVMAGVLAALRVWRSDVDPWGFRLWVVALVALPVGGYLLHPPTLSIASLRDGWKYHVLAGLLLAVGILVRIYHLDRIPPGIFVDETNAAGDALRILSGWRGSPFGVGWFETPLGYVYYMAGLIKGFGPTYATLKAATLIPAVLTLAALYPLAYMLFGPRIAVLALAFLTFNRWHMTMSRWGWNEVAPPLFHILAVYFILKGSRTRNPGHYLLGGIWLGLGMYTYLASRLVVLAVVAYLLYRIVVERGYVRRAGVGLVLFFLAYALTFAPLATTYAKNPFTFLNRSKQVSILNDMRAAYHPDHPLPPAVQTLLRAAHMPTDISFRPLEESTVKHIRMFHIQGDFNPRHNIPGAPLLDPVTGVLFLYGLFYALRYPRDHRHGLLLTWLVMSMLGGILSLVREAPQAYRTLDAVIAVALMAGEVLGAMPIPAPRRETVRRRIQGGVWAALILGAAVFNLRAFFHTWASDDRVWLAFSPMETAVAREVAARLDTNEIYLSPTLYWGSPLRYLTFDRVQNGHPPYHIIQPVEDLPLTQPVGNNALFLLDPVYADLLDLFTEYYPHTRAELVVGRNHIPLYVRVQVPLEDVDAIRGLTATYTARDGRKVTRRDRVVDFRWPAGLPKGWGPDNVQEITWEGSLFIPRSGQYLLREEGYLEIEVDGQPWAGERALGKGLHAIRVRQSGENAMQTRQAVLLWRGPGQEKETPISAHYFFTVTPPQHGLWGEYFKGMNFEGPMLFGRVDRTLLLEWRDPEPTVGPFSARWTGAIWAPTEGVYHFRLDGDDGVRLWLDGQKRGESWQPDTVNQIQADVSLRTGWHSIRVEYFQKGGAKVLRLFWRPPNGKETIVPPSVLVPTSP